MVKDGIHYGNHVCWQAEVERLRAELETQRSATRKAHAAFNEQMAKANKLEAENAELRKSTPASLLAIWEEAEATRAQIEAAALEAKLAWFEKAQPHLLSAIEDYDDIVAVDAAKEWLERNPKPG